MPSKVNAMNASTTAPVVCWGPVAYTRRIHLVSQVATVFPLAQLRRAVDRSKGEDNLLGTELRVDGRRDRNARTNCQDYPDRPRQGRASNPAGGVVVESRPPGFVAVG